MATIPKTNRKDGMCGSYSLSQDNAASVVPSLLIHFHLYNNKLYHVGMLDLSLTAKNFLLTTSPFSLIF